MNTHQFGTGRLVPQDFRHMELWSLESAPTIETAEKILRLPHNYRVKYDQGQEGACVGFASSWMQSIRNKQYYDAFWLYYEAQKVDGWAGEDYDGTSVRAGMDILRDIGHRRIYRGVKPPDLNHGIVANRWAQSVDELRACVQSGQPVVMGTNWYESFFDPIQKGREFWVPDTNIGRVAGGHAWCIYGVSDRRQAFKMVNSWGRHYPLTWFSYDLVDRLLHEYGEATIATDR